MTARLSSKPDQAAAEADFERRHAAVVAAYDRHDALVRAYVASMVVEGEDVKDIVQELWKRVLLEAPEDRIDRLPWLLRKARWLVRDHFRRQSRRRRREVSLDAPGAPLLAATARPEVDVSKESDESLRSAFFENFPDLALTEPQKRILWLYGRHGLTVEEIAAQTQVASSTVHDWIKKGRAQLAEHLQSR